MLAHQSEVLSCAQVVMVSKVNWPLGNINIESSNQQLTWNWMVVAAVTIKRQSRILEPFVHRFNLTALSLSCRVRQSLGCMYIYMHPGYS